MLGKALLIVESPAKAKTINKYLGSNFKVIATMGHIIDLPKKEFGVEVGSNIMPKYVVVDGREGVIKKLREEAKGAEKIYLGTDPDREGEAISWHIARVLGLSPALPCRVEFREITKDAITEAIKKPRQINTALVNAQQARRILDRFVGYMISPLLWDKIGGGLSAGRVQSAALRLICDREEEIRNFKPEEYWTIEAVFTDPKSGKNFTAKLINYDGKKVSIPNRQEAEKIEKEIRGRQYKVTDVKKSERYKNPPEAFTTSTMQQEASKRLGFSAKKTMMIAQQLYEGVEIAGEGLVGLITYMRTDSTRVSDKAKEEARKYIESKFGKEYIGKDRAVKKKDNIQDAHEAIRPTSVERTPEKVKGSLTPEQYKLYKLIWERFMASRMAPAVYDTVTADIKSQDGKVQFRATGSTQKFPGFEVIYKDLTSKAKAEEEGEKEDREEERELPALTAGQEAKLTDVIPKQHFTQPPARYSEATLVKTLDEKGIGRPSTYATIIETLYERRYVEKEKGKLRPTPIGEAVLQFLKKYFPDIVDIKFTAEMELSLDNIEAGKVNWEELVKDFYHSLDSRIKETRKQADKVAVGDETCDKCGKPMVIRNGKFGTFLACSGYPDCKNTKPIPGSNGSPKKNRKKKYGRKSKMV